jgi:hypothetical protein
METNREAAREWLRHEEEADREGRIDRLVWLVDNYPTGPDGFVLNGGYLSMQLLEQAKHSFAYGQFLAAAVLGAAFIERIFAAKFYGAGRDDLERASARDLFDEAFKNDLISATERDALQNVRTLRNPLVHFRRPLHKDSLEVRAVHGSTHPDDVLENDAREILLAAFRVLGKQAV